MTVILQALRHWVCPNCITTEVTPGTVDNRFHNCSGLKGLTAPMVLEGVKCKVEAVERGDYVGKALATLDAEGKAVMAVEVTREDGNDRAVFADCAQTGVRTD